VKSVSNKNSFSYRFSLFSSEKKVLGMCGNENEVLKTEYELVYCQKTKKLYVARFFYDKNSSWLTEPLLACVH
jgi:hypothetical protein